MISIEELEKSLKNDELNSIYLLYGEEIFLLESALKKIKKLFGEVVLGINTVQIDETNYKQLVSDMETPSFGYEKKLIIVRNSGLLKKEGKRKNAELEEYKSLLATYIKENISMIKESLVLVFIEEDVAKSDLYKAIDKEGVVCQFEYQKPITLIKRMKQITNGYNVGIEEATLKYFIEICGIKMQDLINEIRKLIEYVGENGTITKKTIDLLSTKQIETVIFDLTDNLGKKNTKAALDTLHNLIYQKEPIQKIMITLYNHFKKLYVVKLSEKYNRDIARSLNLKPNQMFLVTKYKAQASYFEEKDLKSIIEELIRLDSNSKVGKMDVTIGLETILCRYCS